MNPSARLQAVFELLTEINDIKRPADALVSSYFRHRRYIGSKDRAAIATMLYDVLRHQARLNWWLTKCDSDAAPRTRFLAYLALIERHQLKQIGELFDGKKFSPDELDDPERALLRKLDGHTIEHPSMPDEVKTECAEWAAPQLKERFGKSFVREMRAMLQPAALDLRINPLKTTRDDILAELAKLEMKAEACALSPFGIRVMERPSLNALPMLKNGQVEIQDEGSQLVALLVDAKPGHRVVDFCAGAGGKTLAIAAQMKNKGRIIACDVLAGRLMRSTERFRRAGLDNVEVKALKTEHDPWVKRHKASFDRVLVDAPCSGTGTWRRNPDSRWKNLGPGLDALLTTQASILESAARLVKPEGRLIYATCSLLPEENEKQVEAFLQAHPEFYIVKYNKILDAKTPPCAEPYLMLTPAQHKTDGFFAAVMERKAAATPTPANSPTEQKPAPKPRQPKHG